MPTASGLLASRVLRSRYGIALLLAIVILAIVGAAKLFAGPARPDGGLPVGNASGIPQPTAADDGESVPLPTPTLVTSPGAAAPDQVATAFATAWVNHRGVAADRWLAGLRPYATAALAAKLAGADPATVPADRVTGPAKLIPRAESFVDAAVPVDSGTLRLRLVATGGRWFVDGVDWERT